MGFVGSMEARGIKATVKLAPGGSLRGESYEATGMAPGDAG
jgi:hypothetical protein